MPFVCYHVIHTILQWVPTLCHGAYIGLSSLHHHVHNESVPHLLAILALLFLPWLYLCLTTPRDTPTYPRPVAPGLCTYVDSGIHLPAEYGVFTCICLCSSHTSLLQLWLKIKQLGQSLCEFSFADFIATSYLLPYLVFLNPIRKPQDCFLHDGIHTYQRASPDGIRPFLRLLLGFSLIVTSFGNFIPFRSPEFPPLFFHL